ncbi:unnamed protein product [Brassica oleracea]
MLILIGISTIHMPLNVLEMARTLRNISGLDSYPLQGNLMNCIPQQDASPTKTASIDSSKKNISLPGNPSCSARSRSILLGKDDLRKCERELKVIEDEYKTEHRAEHDG